MKTYLRSSLMSSTILTFTALLSFSHNVIADSSTPEVSLSRAHILDESVAIAKIISKTYQDQIGKSVIKPNLNQSELKQAYCVSECDMFVPRQAVLHLKVPQVDTIKAEGLVKKATTRIDVTALANGFESGTFSTIELQHVNNLEFLPQSSSVPMKSDAQLFLNKVQDWKVVNRPEALPLYQSQSVMLKSISSAPESLKTTIQEELNSGLLNQVRILGKTTQMVKGKPYDVVSMVGLAPGVTYQFRAVNKAVSLSSANALSVEECHVPVCPADFVQ